MKIEDDFLDQRQFNKIQEVMMGQEFPWFYNSVIDFKDDVNKFQFVHMIYHNEAPVFESGFNLVVPILDVIEPFSIVKIKANLLTRTPSIVENEFHVDLGNLKEQPKILAQWTTSIFYINTNNGYTKFEDGTKVESVANRLVTFPANIKHTGTSCTDEKIRVVINFNYYKNTP